MNDVPQAVRILRGGGLVAFPTETVYGLGADATNPAAVARIFAAKGRPATNPLIVHVAGVDIAQRCAAEWPESAEKLSRKFWPGPLTLVVRKATNIVHQVSAGGPTVGLRMPDHPLAMELLKSFDGPIAAPSANRSNRVSPTTAQHVHDELGDSVDLILDGGPCRVGIESTVLDLSGSTASILRPGSISRAQIEAEIGPVQVFAGSVSSSTRAISPGQQVVHYAPRCPAYRFETAELGDVIDGLKKRATSKITIMLISPAHFAMKGLSGVEVIEMPVLPERYARDFYATLRSADDARPGAILVEMPPDDPSWTAVRDRLMRATQSFTAGLTCL